MCEWCPQAMFTEWYWTGSLAAYARFYSQRIDEHAQWEIREYAKVIVTQFDLYFQLAGRFSQSINR